MEHIDTVFIVGNGFDLNLGLKTSYGDFMKSKLIEDYMKNHSNSLINYMYDISQQNWVDIENELKLYSKMINERFTFTESKDRKKQAEQRLHFRQEFNKLCTLLKEYLKTEIENPVNYTEKYVYEVLSKVCRRKSFYIINFNYTNCVERIINADFYEKGAYNMKKIVRHIHGSLDKDIVFGVEDGGDIHPDHVFLYKSHNRHQDIHGLTSIFNNARKIVFFGYSLGQTDHSYFDDFFKKQSKDSCPNKQLTFYYYDTTAYDNLVVQLNKLTENRLSKLKQFNEVSFIPTEEKP